MASRGWYAQKCAKLKKEKIKQMKEMNAIFACDKGYTRRGEGKNDWMSAGTRTHSVYLDERQKERDYSVFLAQQIAAQLAKKYGVA